MPPLFKPEPPGFKRFLLIRRSLSNPDNLTPYLYFVPTDTALSQLVQVAGTRWRVEQSFEMAKQEVGLADYELCSFHAWYRHITLACLAHAFLTILRAQGLDPLDDLQTKGDSQHNRFFPDLLQAQTQPFIPLTLPEIRHLLVSFLFPRPPNLCHILAFSRWRRQHQDVAKRCHYKRNLSLNHNSLQL